MLTALPVLTALYATFQDRMLYAFLPPVVIVLALWLREVYYSARASARRRSMRRAHRGNAVRPFVPFR